MLKSKYQNMTPWEIHSEVYPIAEKLVLDIEDDTRRQNQLIVIIGAALGLVLDEIIKNSGFPLNKESVRYIYHNLTGGEDDEKED